MAKDIAVVDRPPFYITATTREIIAVALNGLMAGIAVWVLAVLLRQFIIVPLFCGNESSALCTNAVGIAHNTATVIVALLSVVTLAKIGVFRPLIISLAVIITAWDLPLFIASGASSIEQVAWTALLFMLLFAVFSWILRLRSFVFSLIAIIVTVVLFRFLILQ